MARTIRRERRFTPPIRSAALRALAEILPRSQSRLLAVAIMPNHLHIIAQQGDRPLAALMQPLLRRIALEVQRAHGLVGPVFWRHYACLPCLDPRHARNAIAYSHLNPVRAGLCADPSQYRWTSHALYAGALPAALPPELARLAPVLDPLLALPLFATGPDLSAERLQSDYRTFLAWSLRTDDGADDDGADGDDAGSEHLSDADAGAPQLVSSEPVPSPPPSWGGPTWAASLSPLFHAPPRSVIRLHDDGPDPPTPDMATIARNTLACEAPGMKLDSIRGRGGGRERTRVRHAIIRRLHEAGYRNVQIATYVGLSESGISYVLCRQQPPQ